MIRVYNPQTGRYEQEIKAPSKKVLSLLERIDVLETKVASLEASTTTFKG